jgi:glycosyltransferase involved in cell wall biosynthesis
MEAKRFMRFVFITQSYPPASCGVSHVVQNLCERLVRYGHDVIVFTEWMGRNNLVIEGVEVREFQVRGNYVLGYSGEVNRFKHDMRKVDCDVVVVECAQTWTLDLSLSEISNKRCLKVFHSHDFSWFKRKSRNPWKNLKWLMYFAHLRHELKLFDIIYCLSDQLPDYRFIAKSYTGMLRVLPNGVSDTYFSNESSSTEFLGDLPGGVKDHYMICLANYSELKNQMDVLDAYLACQPDIDLVFVGSEYNKYSRRLHKHALDNGVEDRVFFLSELTKPEISSLLQAAELFVYASRCEAFPLVICEAIASGTPWVSYNVGCVKDLPGGVVLDSNTPFQLAIQMTSLLNDDSMREHLRQSCIAERPRFSYDKITKRFLQEVTDLAQQQWTPD